MRTAFENRVPQYDDILTGHFREGRAYRTVRRRGTADWLMILTTGGHGRFRLTSGEMLVGPTDVVLIPPGVPHDYGTAPEPGYWQIVWAHFLPRSHWSAWLSWPDGSSGVMRLRIVDDDLYRHLAKRFLDADRLARSQIRGSDLLAMNALEEVLLWCRSICPDPVGAGSDPRVEAARRYLREHIAETIALAQVAEAAGLSVSRLSQIFAEETKTTPMRYLEALRMDRAKSLLTRTNQSIARIAAEVGFDSAFYFSLRFKQASGRSPSEYRARSQPASGDGS